MYESVAGHHLSIRRAANITLVKTGERRKTTLKEVAQEARVGLMTASRVLNGVPGKKVGVATANRVREIAERLGYEPNQQARILRGQPSRVIGLVISDPGNALWAECARAVEIEARKLGYVTMLVATEEDPETEVRQLIALRQKQVDGILLVPASRPEPSELARCLVGIPVVAIDRPVPGITCDTVLIRNRQSAYEATKHLLWHGHRRVAFVGYGPHLYTVSKRVEGYCAAMAEAGLAPSLHFTGDNPSDAADLSRTLLSTPDRPTAIFGMNSHIMLGLITAAKALHLAIPGQLAIAGFEDFEWAAFVKPGLTLIRQPAHDIGTRAAQLLFSRLRGEAGEKSRKVVLAAPLIVRESCGCAAAD